MGPETQEERIERETAEVVDLLSFVPRDAEPNNYCYRLQGIVTRSRQVHII